jgi:hypothetical protein
MTYNLIDSNGYLIKQFENMKETKKYIKDHNIKNYMILKTDWKGGKNTVFSFCLVSLKAF